MPLLFFFNDTATTDIYTLSLLDALPICSSIACSRSASAWGSPRARRLCSGMCPRKLPMSSPGSPSQSLRALGDPQALARSEEHTSELQSRPHLVCRLLLVKNEDDTTSAI